MVFVPPYIPETITVHLGAPDSAAANATVPFADYVKNVVSSEIYPTWGISALRANTFAIVSYALNRVYTEYYRSRGYDFDITNSTAYDQKYISGRSIYENISALVDELFNHYIRRRGFFEPLAAKFCNGTTSTCSGLSQWGSQELAQAGANSVEILRNYYGDDVELVVNAPVQTGSESYPGTPLRVGAIGPYVGYLQVALNRISQNYPAIPKIPVSNLFGEAMLNAVRAFQSIFSLTVDGVVGRATWYQIVRIYVAILNLAELQSEGLNYTVANFEFSGDLSPGDRGDPVRVLQYLLRAIGQFIPQLPVVEQTGVYGEETQQAVAAFQSYDGQEATGSVTILTWNALYRQYASIEQIIFSSGALFPDGTDADASYADTTRFVQFPGQPLDTGAQDGEGAV